MKDCWVTSNKLRNGSAGWPLRPGKVAVLTAHQWPLPRALCKQTHSMENVIYNELRMRGYNVDVGVVPIAEKDKDGKVIRKQLEVDFVCNLGSSRYYIQSAYSLPDEEKRTQEIRPFRKIDDSFKKIVITKDIVPSHYDEFGILTMNIYDFLLDPECLEK